MKLREKIVTLIVGCLIVVLGVASVSVDTANEFRAAGERIAQNTSSQANRLQQTSVSLQEMTAQTQVFAGSTASLLAGSREHARSGTEAVGDVGSNLSEIADQAASTSTSSVEVSGGAARQSASIDEIISAVMALDQVARSNAAACFLPSRP